MIIRFLRLMAGAIVGYLFIHVGYPESGHSIYHTLAPLAILVAAAVLAFALRLLEFGSRTLPVLLEVVFTLAVFAGLGLTMPAKGGPALPQLLEGKFPTQGSLREGLSLVGADPNSSYGKRIIGLFPK